MAKSSAKKVTSNKIAKMASAVLRDRRSAPRTRSIAASALAQAKGAGRRGRK